MDIELWAGTNKAIIDLRGAWLTNLSDDQGDILFPKRLLKTATGDTKLRGGCHVCLPNFGPGGESGQPQHGFGREMDWDVTDKTDNSVLLELTHGRDGYEDMKAELSYQLGERALIMILEVTNRGKKELRVAPAFHPYFATVGDDIKINGDKQPLEAIAEAQFVSGNSQTLQVAHRTITLISEQLPVWAKWTDQLGHYVCVEPSRGGFTFLNDSPNPEEVLPPTGLKTYALTITWE